MDYSISHKAASWRQKAQNGANIFSTSHHIKPKKCGAKLNHLALLGAKWRFNDKWSISKVLILKGYIPVDSTRGIPLFSNL